MELRYGFQVAPGQCFSCGNGDNTLRTFDFGVMPGAGVRKFTVYICERCIDACHKRLHEAEAEPVVEDAATIEWKQRAVAAEARLQKFLALAEVEGQL